MNDVVQVGARFPSIKDPRPGTVVIVREDTVTVMMPRAAAESIVHELADLKVSPSYETWSAMGAALDRAGQ